jgi:hypothetical protein
MSAAAARIDARLKKAKHREIAIRYRNGKKPVSMAALRVADIARLFADRYGAGLPDDDAGRDDVRIMVHHLALMSGDQVKRITSWIASRAPWMAPDAAQHLIEQAIAKPLRWRADKLAVRLNLTAADRSRLGIKTIGACDLTKAEREAARKARKRQTERKGRRAKGVKPRAEYLATSAERAKPWLAEGISRRTWYRRQRAAQ